MSELEYDKNWSIELLAAGLVPNSDPISLRGVIKQILQNIAAPGEYVASVGADNTATITVSPTAGAVKIGVTPGTYVPASGPSQWVIPFASPSGVASVDQANILAAIAAVHAGGAVNFAPGTYKSNAQLSYYPGTRWSGAASGGTILELTTDLYTSGNNPAEWIVPKSGQTFSFPLSWTAEHILFQGPGSVTVGYTPCKTTAVQMMSTTVARRCTAQGFFAGFEMFGNDQTLEDVTSASNYYGIDFPANMASLGNQTFLNIKAAGNTSAGVHISGSGQWDSSVAINLQLGSAPCGILKTDDQGGWDGNGNPTYNGTASTKSGITGCDFTEVNFENVGNGCIIDMSTGGAGSTTLGGSTHWRSLGHSWDTGVFGITLAPYNNTQYQGEWAVVARNCGIGTVIDAGEYPFSAGSVGVWYIAAGGLKYRLNTVTANLLGSGSTFSPANQGGFVVEILGAVTQGLTTSAVSLISYGTINAGDIVEVAGGSYLTVQRATGTKPVFGIALTAGITSGNVLVQTDGFACEAVNCVSLTANEGVVLSCNATTPYLADLATNNPTMPQLGVFLGSASSSTSLTAVHLTTGLPPPSYNLYAVNALTVASNAVTVPVTCKNNKITNNAAGSVAITLATSGASDGQVSVLTFYDYSGVAQTLTYVNTENSSQTAPGTSNGSTTLPLTIVFRFNAATTKWRFAGSY